MTPLAGHIKEGVEPRISQKWFMPSHVQHQHPAPGALAIRSLILLDPLRVDLQIA